MTEQENFKAIDAAVRVLDNVLDRAAEGEMTIPARFREELWEFNRWVASQLEMLHALNIITEVNNAALKLEDLFDEYTDNDDLNNLQSSVENLTFESQGMIDELKLTLGLIDQAPTADQPA